MNRFAKILCTVLIVVFALGPIPASADKKTEDDVGVIVIKKLDKIQAKMKELADEDLRGMDVGKQTQDKEETVIEALDEVIQIILDDEARQNHDFVPGPPTDTEKPGNSKGFKNLKPGDVTGNDFDDCEPDRIPREEWGQAPGKKFDDTTRDSDVPAIPGYEKIVKRYREVKSSRQNSVDE